MTRYQFMQKVRRDAYAAAKAATPTAVAEFEQRANAQRGTVWTPRKDA